MCRKTGIRSTNSDEKSFLLEFSFLILGLKCKMTMETIMVPFATAPETEFTYSEVGAYISPLNPFPKLHIMEGCKAGLCRSRVPRFIQAVYRGYVGFRSAHGGHLHALVLMDSQCCSQQLISQVPAVALLSYSPWERLSCEQPGGQSTQSISRALTSNLESQSCIPASGKA